MGVRVRCEGVVHIYPASGEGLDDVVALRGIDLDVDPGEFVSLLGPSGSGKSTVLGLLAGVLRPSAGRVLIGPHDVGRMAPRSLARLRGSVVALVLQNPSRNLLAYATVRQNVAFAAGPSGESSDELLEGLGLAALADRVTGRLSDGEQQCVAIAAALSSGARLVLADEPTSQLDAVGREHVMELLAQGTRRVRPHGRARHARPVGGRLLGRGLSRSATDASGARACTGGSTPSWGGTGRCSCRRSCSRSFRRARCSKSGATDVRSGSRHAPRSRRDRRSHGHRSPLRRRRPDNPRRHLGTGVVRSGSRGARPVRVGEVVAADDARRARRAVRRHGHARRGAR